MKKHQLQKKTITTTEKTAEEFENMITGMDEESFRNIIRREVAAANSSKRIKRGFEFQEERLVKKQKSEKEEEGPPSNSKPRKFHSRQRKRFYFQRERKAR